jgi:hypothetical protein
MINKVRLWAYILAAIMFLFVGLDKLFPSQTWLFWIIWPLFIIVICLSVVWFVLILIDETHKLAVKMRARRNIAGK